VADRNLLPMHLQLAIKAREFWNDAEIEPFRNKSKTDKRIFEGN
jgi:hypothetical protein